MLRSLLTVSVIALAACAGDATGNQKKFDTTVNASFVMNMTETHQLTNPSGPGCTRQWTVTGNVVLEYSLLAGGGISGDVQMDHAVKALVSATPGTAGGCPTISSPQSVDFGGEVSGTASNFTFNASQTTGTPDGGTETDSKAFAGSVANGVASGTFTYTLNGVFKPGLGTDTQTSTAMVTLNFH